MRTQLDEAMDAKLAQLTGAGGPLVLGSARAARDGRCLPVVTGVPETLPDYAAHYCAQHRDLTFLVAGAERLTFGAVHEQALRVGRALVARGLTPGDRVGIAMRNSPAWIALFLGVSAAGGTAVLLNGWWQGGELAAAVRDVACRLVLADGPRAKRLADVGPGCEVLALDDALPLADALAPLAPLAPLGAGEGPLPDVAATDHATILFTSGSTGVAKGALSDHRAVVQGVYSFLSQALVMLGIATDMGQAPEGQPATLLSLPLFHVTGLVPVFLQSLAMGRKIVLMPRWDAEEAMRLMAAERVTYFVGVPLMSYEMLNHPRRGQYDLSAVTDMAAGGAPRPVDHVRRIADEMGGPAPLIGYGLTETNAVGTGNWRTNYVAKPASAGRASAPLVAVAALDTDGRELPAGETGEVGVRTICNFREYWGRPEETAAAFTADGWFRTGDLGYLDEDGYLFIVDRTKDIIIRGGENIAAQEVEAAIYACPQVAEAAVFGLAHERFGEVPGAVVRVREGAELTADTLRDWLAPRIAAFKLPHRTWIVREPLPRLGTEKIDKVALKARHRALWADEGGAAG